MEDSAIVDLYWQRSEQAIAESERKYGTYCSTWRDWKTGDTGDYDEPLNHVVLFHPEQGWIFAIRGTLPLEDLVKIARGLEVEQTEGLVEQSQFSNPYDTFDAGQG